MFYYFKICVAYKSKSHFVKTCYLYHLMQCFPNCGAVDPGEPPGGPRDPLTNAHHICCSSSFAIFYILIHLITLVLPFRSEQFILVYVVWHKGCLFVFFFYQGVHAESEFGKPWSNGCIFIDFARYSSLK